MKLSQAKKASSKKMSFKKMTGLLELNGKRYLFRNDDGNWEGFVAWEIEDDKIKPMTHKWKKLPKGVITLFDFENPPKSVGYLPQLGAYSF